MEYINEKISVTCPVCKRKDCVKLWETTCEESAQHFSLKETNSQNHVNLANHIEHLWGQRNNTIVNCLNCGICFSTPFIAGDERFYSLAYQRTNYPNWKWEYQITLDHLRYRNYGFKFLEIGAGNGTFIKSFSNKLTPKENIYCTEYSAYGLMKLKEIGINFYNEDVRNLKIKVKFDVICIFQVLEHLDDLDNLFKTIDNLLMEGGDLFVAVPHPSFIEYIELNGALLDMPPNHITRWTFDAFQIIATTYNWEIKNYLVEPATWMANSVLFAKYYFLKQSQAKGSYANIISSLQIPLIIKKYLKIIGVLVYSFALVNDFYRLKSKCVSNSQWIQFTKKTK